MNGSAPGAQQRLSRRVTSGLRFADPPCVRAFCVFGSQRQKAPNMFYAGKQQKIKTI